MFLPRAQEVVAAGRVVDHLIGQLLAGVERDDLVFVGDGRPRPDADAVRARLGRQSDGKVRPVDEVFAHGVAPVDVPPIGAVGVKLVEDVVPPLPVDRGMRARSSN